MFQELTSTSIQLRKLLNNEGIVPIKQFLG